MATKTRGEPPDEEPTANTTTFDRLSRSKASQRLLLVAQIVLFTIIVAQFIMMYRSYVAAAALALVGNAQATTTTTLKSSTTTAGPDYYNTDPNYYPGPTPTGAAAFLAQYNPAPFASVSYIPNSPLETQVPIVGNTNHSNIYQLHGQLSHYFLNPDGFGVHEYSLPHNASIVQLNMLSRHGSRYPTTGSGAPTLAGKLGNYTNGTLGHAHFNGSLDFLNTWTYKLGAEILVPIGKQELFDSGTLHQIMYGHLNPNNGTKIIARSTTQSRMRESAEYFLAGFFGLGWTNNASLVLSIEGSGPPAWNNSLAGYFNCPNSNKPRFNANSTGFDWTVVDVYNAQSLCAYETVALGYSSFCGLFTYEEWEGYEYSIDLQFSGNNMFESPTGRGVGIGYVSEFLARLQHHLITKPTAQVNVTLDSNPATFPLYQSLNFDFSHDTNIAAILTAFGLTQFAKVLPTDHIDRNRPQIVSHLTPFGARLDVEIIETPKPLSGDRKAGVKYDEGSTTRYVHFILNQRTIPLGASFSKCGKRDDGWCELTTFMEVQSTKLEEAKYEYSCFGNYTALGYGNVTNGVPVN
ncbi:uncharacterized protein MYCGRDRAFT_69914 [Zymoseptoria tritici IPO323]|uniref:3-phytase n=1 Tax=Zymoseptoria tritici (strain CBS 115943 / IPO323) TaxID=336722 RepID=F9X5Q8_ZYMTI|nr:uncharacterized protein MYCGRDRAFT_69914 [Zymoseptoria tritici IPO323]EGP89370.1 hypothetical protein MYCGRDRAFT_69914 [Zymoseptoria tritici IPO323]